MPADPFCCVFLVKQLVKLPQWWAQAGGTAAAQPFLYARAAVKSNEKGPSNGKLFTEEDWNVESKCDKAGAYSHSKVHLKAVRNSQAFLEIQKLTVLCTHEKHVALASALDSLGCMDSAPLNIISCVTPLWCQATWSPHQVTHSYLLLASTGGLHTFKCFAQLAAWLMIWARHAIQNRCQTACRPAVYPSLQCPADSGGAGCLGNCKEG